MRDGLHQIFIEKGVMAIMTKHVSIDGNVYPVRKRNQYDTFDNRVYKVREDHDDAEPHDDHTAGMGNTPQCVQMENKLSRQNNDDSGRWEGVISTIMIIWMK